MSEKAYYAAEIVFVLAIILVSTSMAGCDVIGGIFKAGIWVGVILVAVLIAVIAGIARMMRR